MNIMGSLNLASTKKVTNDFNDSAHFRTTSIIEKDNEQDKSMSSNIRSNLLAK